MNLARDIAVSEMLLQQLMRGSITCVILTIATTPVTDSLDLYQPLKTPLMVIQPLHLLPP